MGEGLMGGIDWSTMNRKRERERSKFFAKTKLTSFSCLAERDGSGFLPIHFAALKGKVPIIRKLAQICLERGETISSLVDDNNNQRKQTPLHWACTKNEV
jgi:ankyrin repeat protein